MIIINLLPKNLRKTERKIALPNKVYLFRLIVGLILVHFLLFSLIVIKKIQVVSLKKTWVRMEPESRKYSSIKVEVKDLEARVNSVKEFLSRRASFGELFSDLNAVIPKGLWLERFSFSDDGLIIQGSVVSLSQNEMTIISKFLQDLRKNKAFSSIFSKIELNSVQRRTIKTYDVVDFVLVGDLKQ